METIVADSIVAGSLLLIHRSESVGINCCVVHSYGSIFAGSIVTDLLLRCPMLWCQLLRGLLRRGPLRGVHYC